jgi:hypothetical protein
MKHKTYVKVPPLKDNLDLSHVKPMQLTEEQETLMMAYASIQQESMAIDMVAGQYAMASMQQNKAKKRKCADLMVERALVLLEAASKLASLE